MRLCVRLATLGTLALAVACRDEFVSAPARFSGNVQLRNWVDTLVIGDRHTMTARLLDQQGREVLDRTFQWTVADSSVLTLSVSSTGDGDSTRVAALRPGATQVAVRFVDPLFEEANVSKPLSVVVAGVVVTTADTTLTAAGDTMLVLGSALGHDSTGTNVAVASQGITWAKTGAATTLVGEGDTVRVVAAQDGVDTLVAAHPHCLAAGSCVDTATVTVAIAAGPGGPAPTPGGDVVVFNDVNMWQTGTGGERPENVAFFNNLVGFTGSGPRASGQTVMFYTGASSLCGDACTTNPGGYGDALIAKLQEMGYTLVDETTSLANIPADVKLLFIWMPGATIPAQDINGLKRFAQEGGRVVVVGENEWYYGAQGIAVENQLLLDLGAQLTNQGGCAMPGEYAAAEGSHQLVTGVSQIFMWCVSPMTPGPNDFVLFRDSGGQVVGAVAKIDLTPLP
jgi:hypothetical protein